MLLISVVFVVLVIGSISVLLLFFCCSVRFIVSVLCIGCNLLVSDNLLVYLICLSWVVLIWLLVVRMFSVIGRLNWLFFLGSFVGVRFMMIFLLCGKLRLLVWIVVCMCLCDFFILVFVRFIRVKEGRLLVRWILMWMVVVYRLLSVWLWMMVRDIGKILVDCWWN